MTNNLVHNEMQVPELPVLSSTAGQGKNPSGITAAVSDAGQARTRESSGCASARPTSKESQ